LDNSYCPDLFAEETPWLRHVHYHRNKLHKKYKLNSRSSAIRLKLKAIRERRLKVKKNLWSKTNEYMVTHHTILKPKLQEVRNKIHMYLWDIRYYLQKKCKSYLVIINTEHNSVVLVTTLPLPKILSNSPSDLDTN
jgi:hypothetical protein